MISGRLNIYNYDDYMEVGGNNIAGRAVNIYRNSSLYAGAVTNGTANPNNNWSKSVTATVSVTTTYTFYAGFSSLEPTLGSKTSSSFTVTWVKPALC